jgi:NADH-quinone oxidoreductase subunit N
MQAHDLISILPELLLLVTACAVLLIDTFLKKDKTALVAVSVTGLLASGVISLALVGQDRVAFSGMLALNSWAVFFNVLFAFAGALTVLMSSDYLEAHKRHMGEYYVLLVFAVIGIDLMAASRDLISFYVSLELMAISSYILAGFFRYRSKSTEASIKYFLSGVFASAIMLYGISLIYGLTGATNFAAIATRVGDGKLTSGLILAVLLVAIGLAFKVSAVPFHFWTPDAYQGAPTPIAGFFSVGPKAAAFSVIVAAFVVAFPQSAREWGVFFIVLSVITMVIGNLFGLVQTNIKRMLAYSSIAHAGYLLAAVGAIGFSGNLYPGVTLFIYLAAYTFMNLGAFGVLTYLKGQLPDKFDYSLKQFAGLGRRSPWACSLLSLFLLSLTGIPGTAGFIGKFYVFGSVVNAHLTWLAVLGVILSAVSAYYYLRVIIYMFFKEPEEELEIRHSISGGMAAALTLCATATIVIGLLPSWLYDAAARAIGTISG